MTSLCMTLQQLDKAGVYQLLEQCIVDKSNLIARKAQVATQKEDPIISDIEKAQYKAELIKIKEKLQKKQT